MKKSLVLVLALMLVLGLGVTVSAGLGEVAIVDDDGYITESQQDAPDESDDFINSDYDTVDASIAFHFDKVIYLTLDSNSHKDLRGFDKKSNIKDGYISWNNVHRVTVDAATDYVLACNINTGGSTFEDVYGMYQNDVTRDDASAPANNIYDDGRSNSVSEGIFKNFTLARATTLKGDGNSLGWQQVDTCGPYAKQDDNENEGDIESKKFEALAYGSNTLGEKGDKYRIDYTLDFVDHFKQLENTIGDGEVPSGKYRVELTYMVVEE